MRNATPGLFIITILVFFFASNAQAQKKSKTSKAKTPSKVALPAQISFAKVNPKFPKEARDTITKRERQINSLLRDVHKYAGLMEESDKQLAILNPRMDSLDSALTQKTIQLIDYSDSIIKLGRQLTAYRSTMGGKFKSDSLKIAELQSANASKDQLIAVLKNENQLAILGASGLGILLLTGIAVYFLIPLWQKRNANYYSCFVLDIQKDFVVAEVVPLNSNIDNADKREIRKFQIEPLRNILRADNPGEGQVFRLAVVSKKGKKEVIYWKGSPKDKKVFLATHQYETQTKFHQRSGLAQRPNFSG